MRTLIMRGLPLLILPAFFTFSACSSLKPMSYAFAEDETNSASISFTHGNPSVSFVFFDDKVLPDPESGTFWDPLTFPSSEPLEITVHAYYHQEATTAAGAGLLGALISTAVTSNIAASRSVDIDVLFSCPPLESGKDYSLSFRKEAGSPGINRLILIDIATKKIIYQQEFEMR
jgi:hypothetical protein